MMMSTTGEYQSDNWSSSIADLASKKYLEKLAIAQKRIECLLSSDTGTGKIVIWLDKKNGDEGYIVRIESISIDKY